MSELTKLEILSCFSFYVLGYRLSIDRHELDSLNANIKMLLKSYYVLDVECFSSELRKIYLGAPDYLFNYVNKFLKVLERYDSYIS